MYRLKISGEQFQSEIEGAQDWSRSVMRDFQDRLFRTRGEYRFVGHKGLYNLLYNHMAANGVCEALTGRIYFNGGDGWDYEWKGELKPQDCEFDIIRRSVDTQVLDDSWAAKFHNAKDQKVFLRSAESKNGVYIGPCNSELVLIFNPTTGAYDVDLRRMFKMYDVFDFLVKYYSDGTVTFASDYFSTGDGAIYFITTGSEIRSVNEAANPEISFSAAFDEMNKKCNLWIVIEGTPDAPVLRIEPWDYVFQELKVVEIRDPEGLKLKIDLDQLYTTINVGSEAVSYNPTEDARYPNVRFFAWNNESYNTAGACQFENNVLDLVSTWKIDNNSIEQQYASVGDDTGPFDDDIFMIDVEQLGGSFFAIRYETDYTGPDTVLYAYNQSLINEAVIIRWFNGIPQQIIKEISTGVYARVSRDASRVFGAGPPYPRIPFNNETTPPNEDSDNVYDLANEQFVSPISNYYRFSGEIFINVLPNSALDGNAVITIYSDDTRTTQIGEIFGDTVAIPCGGSPCVASNITLPYDVSIFMPAGSVGTVTVDFTDFTFVIILGVATPSYCIFETDLTPYLPEATSEPMIYIYDMARHTFTPDEFDLIDQGRGFVRIIDTQANRSYDVWAKDVKYNRWTNIIQGEFIGRQAPIELCWILDGANPGTWSDDCFWNDDDFWNEPQFRPFIITVDTTNAGVSANDAFRISTTGGGYNYTVDWGDGQVDYGQTGTREHTYAAPGTYTIKIYGDFPRIYFNNTDDCLKLLSIDQWGDVVWSTMAESFYGCANMQGNFSDAPVLIITENLEYMFAGCSSFDWDLDDWDLSNVTSLSATFYQCSIFNGDVTTWDVSNVTTFSDTFRDAPMFNQNIGSWNTSSATSMYSMLMEATVFNQDISSWDTSGVTDMTQMFFNASAFNQNISGWDVSNVTEMSSMLRLAVAFNQPIGAWNTSAVTNMASMLRDATVFEQDIGAWDISLVTIITNFMTGITLTTANYDALLIGWTGWSGGVPTRPVQPNLTTNFGGSTYSLGTDAEDARNYLIGTEGWTITDGGGV